MSEQGVVLQKGPRAVWQGEEYPADFTPDQRGVELVHVGQRPPVGFETVRPQVSRKIVTVGECDRARRRADRHVRDVP